MKKILITGANKSIGFEVARQLLQLGHYVYLGSRDIEKGEEAVKKLKAEGFNNVETIKIDVSDAASVNEAKEALLAKTDTLDILINNAGVSGGFPQTTSGTGMDTMRKVFDINFFGAVQVTQAFMNMLAKSTQPRIVNVTSGLASLTLHNDSSWKYYQIKGAAYGPSKTALNAYTVALAYNLKDTPFKVNVVDPGFTATDFNNHRGTGTVDEAAARLVKCALITADGPTGLFFSDDNNPETGISLW